MTRRGSFSQLTLKTERSEALAGVNTTRMQGTNVTFRLQHFVFLLMLSAVSSIPFAAAQNPPVGSVTTSLDLTLHVHPDFLTQPGTSSGDRGDCHRRKDGESTPKSEPGNTPSIHVSKSDLLSANPGAKACPDPSTDGPAQYTEGFNEKGTNSQAVAWISRVRARLSACQRPLRTPSLLAQTFLGRLRGLSSAL